MLARIRPQLFEVWQWQPGVQIPKVKSVTGPGTKNSCRLCGKLMSEHAWVSEKTMVCPGDWIVKTAPGDLMICPEDEFELIFELQPEKEGE